MPSSATSSRRNSAIPSGHQTQRPSLAIPDLARYSRRLSTSSQSTNYNRRKSMAMPRSDTIHHTPKYTNTYKTAPDETKKFRTKDVTDLIESVLKERLEGLHYSADRCRRLLVPIAEEIKNQVKLLGFERYKIVCVVHIGSLSNQDVRVASRCLWDTSFDRVASSSFCNETLFASASVFGVYQE